MKFALCIENDGSWIQVDQAIEADTLVLALSRLADRYQKDSLIYQEVFPNTVVMEAIAYDHDRKIQAIKDVRNITGLGLKEAKDAVESTDFGRRINLGSFPLANARQLTKDYASITVVPAEDTHPGVKMVLAMQKNMGGFTLGS